MTDLAHIPEVAPKAHAETRAHSGPAPKPNPAAEIGYFTLEGVRNAQIDVVPFQSGDGLGLTLTRFTRAPCDDVVLLIHGLTSSSDMFIMPEHENLVTTLLASGFTDVWCMDGRISNRFPYNLRRHGFTFDDVALYDYPPAIDTIRGAVGPERRLHVICHCVGSITFTMSLFAGKVQGITSVISNSVSLTPRVSSWSRFKLLVAPGLVQAFTPFAYIDPNWAHDPGFSPGRLLSRLVSLAHRECDEPACHMVSFMWGDGNPAVFKHENLDPRTHARIGQLFGGTSMHYHVNVRKMVRAGEAVPMKKDAASLGLPARYLANAAHIETPILFVTGSDNRVFFDSNIECHRRLEELVPGRHSLKVFQGYGHQDVFQGKDSARDVFPTFVEFLKEWGGGIGLRKENPHGGIRSSRPG